MKCSLGVSNFLEEISRLSHPIVFLYFFAVTTEEGVLISPCYSLELCIQMGISFLSSFAFTTMKPVFPVVSITCSFHRWILLSITALYKEQTCVVSIKEKNYCTCFMWNASSSAKLKETNRLNVLECCSHMEERPRVEPLELLPGAVLNSWYKTEMGFDNANWSWNKSIWLSWWWPGLPWNECQRQVLEMRFSFVSSGATSCELHECRLHLPLSFFLRPMRVSVTLRSELCCPPLSTPQQVLSWAPLQIRKPTVGRIRHLPKLRDTVTQTQTDSRAITLYFTIEMI